MAAHAEACEWVLLPPYAPELNPDEILTARGKSIRWPEIERGVVSQGGRSRRCLSAIVDAARRREATLQPIEARRLLPRAANPGPEGERLLVGSPGHETTDDPTDPILPGIDAEATGRRAIL